MHILSEVIPIWGLEKITRQYVGFSDLVIKEYHDTLGLKVNSFYSASDSNAICSKKIGIMLFQWRGSTNNVACFPYIYNTRIYFDKNLSREQLLNRFMSGGYEILGSAVRFK